MILKFGNNQERSALISQHEDLFMTHSKSLLKIIQLGLNPDELVLLESLLKPYYMANSADSVYYGDSYQSEYGAYRVEEKRKANKLKGELVGSVCNPIYQAMASIVKDDEALDEWGACGHELHWDHDGNVYQGALDGETSWHPRDGQFSWVTDNPSKDQYDWAK